MNIGLLLYFKVYTHGVPKNIKLGRQLRDFKQIFHEDQKVLKIKLTHKNSIFY